MFFSGFHAVQVPVSDIRIKKRIRKDVGDLDALMESLEAHGQVNPVLITARYELIAGHRRLESARRLGWQSVDARIVNDADACLKLTLEIEENLHRLDLTDAELAEARSRLERLKNPGLLRRLYNAFVRFITSLLARF